MTRWWSVVAALAVLGEASVVVVGCDSGGGEGDDWSGAIVCTEEVVGMTVRVVDVDGVGVAGATVTARNLANGRQRAATTSSDGTTFAFAESLGEGLVSMRATFGERSASGEVTWLCGGCHCRPTPSTLTLVL